jgi:hypothetical protein
MRCTRRSPVSANTYDRSWHVMCVMCVWASHVRVRKRSPQICGMVALRLRQCWSCWWCFGWQAQPPGSTILMQTGTHTRTQTHTHTRHTTPGTQYTHTHRHTSTRTRTLMVLTLTSRWPQSATRNLPGSRKSSKSPLSRSAGCASRNARIWPVTDAAYQRAREGGVLADGRGRGREGESACVRGKWAGAVRREGTQAGTPAPPAFVDLQTPQLTSSGSGIGFSPGS